MRVHIDLTNSPHVTLFTPMIRELEAAGHTVLVTARDFAQTVQLAELHGLTVDVIGRHGGASRLGKARAAARRTTALWRHLRRHQRSETPIDISISHGSTDAPVVCRRLRIPHISMFDYEWATTMHRINCRNAWRVVTPDAIPPERLWRFGAAGKLVQYPGLKESYYLDRSKLNTGIRDDLGIAANSLLAVLRPPPELALYHRGRTTDPFAEAMNGLLATESCTVVVLPRTDEQRTAITRADVTALSDGRLIVPTTAIDGPSLVAAADLVVSAGGTMNREAAALATPVWTMFQGEPAAVDEALEHDGLLHRLDASDVATTDWRAKVTDASAAAVSSDRWHLRPMSELINLIMRGAPVDDWAPIAVADAGRAAPEPGP